MPELSNEDRELAERARQKAGGPAALARLFGLSKQAVGEWGTTRPIPRLARRVLRDYVGDPDVVSRADYALFYEFTARVAGHKQLRRVVRALADNEEEEARFERAMQRAEELER